MGKDTLRVGVGRATINLPDSFFPVENFTGIHDELCARVLLIHNELKIAIVSLELTSLPENEISTLQKIIGREADVSAENVWICVTHTFSAPHIRSANSLKTELDHQKNNMLRKAIEDAVQEAVSQAVLSLTYARLGVGKGVCSINVNRDILTAKGWWLGSNESGISDKSVTVLRFENMEGQPVALLFSYGVQSSVMDGSYMSDGSRLVSADLTGSASRYVEEKYEGKIIALFCIGAAGDQAPAYKAKYIEMDKEGQIHEEDIREQGFMLTKLLGNRLGGEVVQISEKIECLDIANPLKMKKIMFKCSGQVIPRNIRDIHPTKEYEYILAEERNVEIDAIQIGDISLLGVKPELCCSTAMEIKAHSPFSETLIFTLVNGGAKYMADEQSYENVTYESMNSFFARGSAEFLRDKSVELLMEMINK